MLLDVATAPLPEPAGPDAEAALLRPFLGAYRRRFGVAPALARDDHGLLLRFPAHDVPAHAAVVGRVDVLGGHPAVRAYLQRLGFTWDARGVIDGAPAPASLIARAPMLGPRPRYYQAASSAMNKRTWLEGNLRGELPLALGTAAYYTALALASRLRLPEPRRVRAGRDYHFFGVQHDLSKHLLLTHRVPRPLLLDLGRALADGLRRWHRGPLVSAPLVRFYENDLLAYCQQIWRDLADPSQFAPTCLLPANLDQLWRAVDDRLRESAAGPHTWLWNDADTCPTFRITRPARAT
ncbi:hypothetical protein OV203_02905 [Nannocystis sp. ILAH1]|uniref:hypothetical protein n=1 Tax=unclassified Nannocystis TaxID=2627009 RepID=UPI0022702A89|nr:MULTISPECIES: hypothetical protein [unclassified Nannocystis]MCY0986061.1 hypothetical protein [Nannocystis sp. ILAH1]MCY1068657.1 hypothetical protein [Nannocystis sp. RBIL2]